MICAIWQGSPVHRPGNHGNCGKVREIIFDEKVREIHEKLSK